MTDNEVQAKREREKRRFELYREAAAKQCGVNMNPHAHVHPLPDGAFVEVAVWIPLDTIEPLCPGCKSRGFEPRTGKTAMGVEFQGCEFCVNEDGPSPI